MPEPRPVTRFKMVTSDFTGSRGFTPAAHGMPEDGLVVQLNNSPVFEITPTGKNDDYAVLVRFAARDPFESGWLIGEQRIARQAAMVAAKVGAVRVVLIGFRTQHRAQTHGAFKAAVEMP